MTPTPPPQKKNNNKKKKKKKTDQNILFLNEWIPFNLQCRFNECGIKLLIRINNYL